MEGGGGAQLLLISFATTRLHGICNRSINRIEDGGHTLQPHSLGTGNKCPPHPPQISEFFVWDWEGAQKCFFLRDQTTGDLTFTSRGYTHSPVCAPKASFSFSRVVMWVICYHINNFSLLCITLYIVAISYFA